MHRHKMDHILGKIITLSIIAICFGLFNGTKVFSTPCDIESTKVILIDPGHGGIDGGAVSIHGVLEKHINLSISLKLRDKLQRSGYKVVMTREEDKGLYTKNSDANTMKREDLANRCRLKRDSNCDLFISIHQNFFKEEGCSGAQIWYSENEESKILSHILQTNLIKDLDTYKREEKQAKGSYKILRCYANIPSVIVECGFLTNPKEEKKLVDCQYQDKIADSIVRCINEYYEAQ